MATQTQQLTWDGLKENIAIWAESQGWPYGVPIPSLSPSVTNRCIVARRAPFADKLMPTMDELEGITKPFTHICHDKDMFQVVNEWDSYVDGRKIYIIINENGKREVVKENPYHLHQTRFKLLLETGPARLGATTAIAEMNAFCNLISRLNQTQQESYILNGGFAETSKRSRVTYLFRKGFPTLALKKNEETDSTRFLAALCLHPLAFYDQTFAGAMAPSDEVLATLLMMRGDEHRLWRESNQHTMWDPRSGV
jgi:hypothetical protein